MNTRTSFVCPVGHCRCSPRKTPGVVPPKYTPGTTSTYGFANDNYGSATLPFIADDEAAGAYDNAAGFPGPPAGSARDCFLHVTDPETVVGELRAALGERAEVRLAAELFPDAGPRLQARLADVCVLPAPGRMAWLAAFPTRERRFRGAHGGLAPAEAETWLGRLRVG